MFEYQIMPEINLLTTKVRGGISMGDIERLFHVSIDKYHSLEGKDCVLDLRGATLLLSLKEVDQTATLLKERFGKIFRLAILSDRSIDTAKIMLFRDSGFYNMNIEVFSSLEGAGEYLGKNLDHYFEDSSYYREDLYVQ